jgi:ubiquinone/menaquinone biosynthesis C-methylase UbiE
MLVYLLKESKIMNDDEKFWNQRSAHYDKLFWTKDEDYLNEIIKIYNPQKNDLVLDVGTGTGAIAKKIRHLVNDVIGIDVSESMLSNFQQDGFSLVKWDIRDALFTNNRFDKIVARMVFHHIIKDFDIAIKRCYDMLKPNGIIVIAEGIPLR